MIHKLKSAFSDTSELQNIMPKRQVCGMHLDCLTTKDYELLCCGTSKANGDLKEQWVRPNILSSQGVEMKTRP